MEVVTIDLDISSDWKISWGDELHLLVDILILLSGKEWSLDNTRILLSWLENRDGVVSQVERDDEPSVNILWHLGVESSCESQNLFIVINIFEEINLWLLGDEVIDVSERVNLITEAVMWWNLNDDSVSWSHWHDVAHWEMFAVSLEEVVLGECVHSFDLEASSVSDKISIVVDLITCQISVTNELLTWLIYCEGLRKFLSSQINRERISSVIWEMNFSDLNSVVSKEVVPHKLQILASCEESKNLSIVVQELFLGCNFSSSELFLEEFEQLLVFFWWDWLAGLYERVFRASLSISLWAAHILLLKRLQFNSKV
jgi:hypothetical protein